MATIDSYPTSNIDSITGATYTPSTSEAYGACFTGDGQKIVSSSWYLTRIGTVTGNLVSKIYAMTGTFGTNGNVGTLLATSDNLAVSSVSTSGALATFTFSGANQFVTTNGTHYVVTMETQGLTGATGGDAVRVSYDASSPTHPGTWVARNAGAWTSFDAGIDMVFYVDGTPVVVNVTVNLTGVSATPAIGTGTTGIVGGFNPATITGLTVWLKADSLLLGNNDPVSPWTDMSGNANDGVITGTPAPKIRANALNGLPVVRFTVNEGRVRGETDLTIAPTGYNFSIFYIGRMVGPNVGRIFAGGFPLTNFLLGYHTTGQDIAYDNGWLGTAQPYSVLPTLWRVWSFTANHNGTVYTTNFYRDGAFIAGASGGGGLQTPYMLSGYDPTGTAETCDCEVAELLIYNHALSTADRQAVEKYLSDQYLNVVLTGVAANPQVGVGAVAIQSIALPDQGLVAGGVRRGWVEDETVYLEGVAASPEIGKVTPIGRGTLDDLERKFPFPRQPEEPKRIRRLVPPKPIPLPMFVYMAGVNTMPRIGTGKVTAHFEDIDEELMALLGVL